MSLAEDEEEEEGEELNKEESRFPAPVKKELRKLGFSGLGGGFGRRKGDEAETANRLLRRIFPPDPVSSVRRDWKEDNMERDSLLSGPFRRRYTQEGGEWMLETVGTAP